MPEGSSALAAPVGRRLPCSQRAFGKLANDNGSIDLPLQGETASFAARVKRYIGKRRKDRLLD